MKAILVVVALAGCSPTAWKVSDGAALAASELSLACDWAQTHTGRSVGWVETNAVLGDRPSTRTVDTYFATAMVANAALWYVLPTKWRSALGIAVTTAEVESVRENNAVGARMCYVPAPIQREPVTARAPQ